MRRVRTSWLAARRGSRGSWSCCAPRVVLALGAIAWASVLRRAARPGRRGAPAGAAVRARGGGLAPRSAVAGRRLPREPAEHADRAADPGDVRRRSAPGDRAHALRAAASAGIRAQEAGTQPAPSADTLLGVNRSQEVRRGVQGGGSTVVAVPSAVRALGAGAGRAGIEVKIADASPGFPCRVVAPGRAAGGADAAPQLRAPAGGDAVPLAARDLRRGRGRGGAFRRSTRCRRCSPAGRSRSGPSTGAGQMLDGVVVSGREAAPAFERLLALPGVGLSARAQRGAGLLRGAGRAAA